MASHEKRKSAEASPPELSAQVRIWAVALSAVAGLIAYVVANPDVWRLAVLLAVASFTIVPILMLCLVVMYVALRVLSFWMRSPNRIFIARSFTTIIVMTLMWPGSLYQIQYTTGLTQLTLIVLLVGLGGASIMFIEIVVPKWEERGYLRYPKVEPQLVAEASPVSVDETAMEEQRPSGGISDGADRT